MSRDSYQQLNGSWLERDQQRKLYKWSRGETAPEHASTITLLRFAGMLNEELAGWGAAPPAPEDPISTRLAALEALVAELPTAEDLGRAVSRLQGAIDRLASEDIREAQPVKPARKRGAR